LQLHRFRRNALQPSLTGLPLPCVTLQLPAVEFTESNISRNINDYLATEPSPCGAKQIHKALPDACFHFGDILAPMPSAPETAGGKWNATFMHCIGDGWMRAKEARSRPPTLDPRRRKIREHFGGHACEAAGCLRRAFLRSQTRARSAAVRAVPAVASAMAGTTLTRWVRDTPGASRSLMPWRQFRRPPSVAATASGRMGDATGVKASACGLR
jgi:hypothetical protein